jgi:ubiquinone/menaquinone biosynthesis C-methylase UbiE
MAGTNLASRHEDVMPVPVRVGSGPLGEALFAIRRAVDLQLCTIWRVLGPILPKMRGSLLDVGCGEMPFRFAFHPDLAYTGLDVAEAVDFGMTGNDAIKLFDGTNIPFADNSFDNILCTEVIEHALDPETLVKEMHRVLKPGGHLVLTVPFSARVHHAPHDYHRFTRYRLAQMFNRFGKSEIAPRGNDISAIANKLIVLLWRSARPTPLMPLRLLLALPVAPVAALFLAAAHITIRFGGGSIDDPLGYSVVAVK